MTMPKATPPLPRRATWASGTPRSGSPRTWTAPSAISRSAAAASRRCAATSRIFWRSAPPASRMAGPALAVTRLAKLPMPYGMAPVSPVTTSTSSKRTPTASAAIWANVVW